MSDDEILAGITPEQVARVRQAAVHAAMSFLPDWDGLYAAERKRITDVAEEWLGHVRTAVASVREGAPGS